MKDKFNKLKENLNSKFKEALTFINKKNKYSFMEVVALMIIASIFGMLLGGVLMYKKGSLNTGVKKELNEFFNTYTEVLNEYYEEDERGQ